jgi:MFS family permease
MGILDATRYVLRIRTNVVLIIAGACGYYFLAGVQTFGMEFVTKQYHLSQFLAGLLMLFVGAGAVGGVLVAGWLSDRLLARGVVAGRVLVSAVAASVTVVAFIPAILTHSPLAALPYIVVAAFFLGAQNPPIDAARLDIVPPLLWGRAEGVRTMLRTAAQAVAPTLFGVFSEYVFHGGGSKTAESLQWTFIVMLLPLAANAVILFRAMRTYPRDVVTAAAGADRERAFLPVHEASAGAAVVSSRPDPAPRTTNH